MVAGQLDDVFRHIRIALGVDGVTDGQLLERFLSQKDESAFALLVRRHAPMVWGVCRRALRHHDAEDAFQATFLVLARKAESIRQRESVGSWLYGTAYRTALEARAVRRRSREVQVDAVPEPELAGTGSDPDLRALLDEELNRLPDKYREALVLCDLEGRTREDAARHAGLACGTLSGRLTTARRLLAERLARRGLLPTTLLALLLGRKASATSVPESLVTCAITTALGSTPAPPVAANLAEGVLKAMAPNKLTLARVTLLALVALGVGAILLAVRGSAAEGEGPVKENAPFFAAPLPASDDKKPAEPPAKEKAKEDKDHELHVVGVGSGFTKSNGQIHGDRAQVQVSRPGKKVTLVLVAHKPMTWEVGVSKGTTIEKVILGGNKAAVKGLPEKVEVIEAFRGAKDAKLPFAAYKVDDPGFRSIVEALDDMTGRKLSSFTGVDRADADSVIAVEDVSDDERFSIDYPKPVPAAKLPKLTFQAHREVPGKLPHEVTRSFGEFTLAGPKAGAFQPLPDRVSRMAYDPNGKKYYGIADHGLAALDLEKKKVNKLDPGLGVPEISWPADVAFDTKHDRVLLTSSGGGGYLYAYYPKTGKWEALAEKPPNAIVYHPKDGVVYGLKGDLRGGVPELQEINAKGAVVTSVKLDGQFLPGIFVLGPGPGSVQLVAADDKLVMLINPVNHFGAERPAPKWSYMYLLDQKTGKAQLVWKEKVVKEKDGR